MELHWGIWEVGIIQIFEAVEKESGRALDARPFALKGSQGSAPRTVGASIVSQYP